MLLLLNFKVFKAVLGFTHSGVFEQADLLL